MAFRRQSYVVGAGAGADLNGRHGLNDITIDTESPSPPQPLSEPTSESQSSEPSSPLTSPSSICSVGPTTPSNGGPVPFFPSTTLPPYIDPEHLAAVPDLPKDRTIFNEAHVTEPLGPWQESAKLDPLGQDVTIPASTDGYLFPFLTKNERNRLTALWYYTRGLEHDKPFLAHLRETLDLVQELIPYDTIILGIMDKDVYTRLVTTNIATAILSRRESTCAHTINQPSGTTFNIPDMAADPRFSGSPPVAGGVITTYAGANLRFSIARANGQPEEVVLGALCAANFTLGRSLSPLQEKALVRFADMIVHEIIERARTIRATERHTMAAYLATITTQVNAANAVDVVLGALRSTYPNADVSLQSRPDGTILINGTSPLPYHKFKHHLYEDSAQIEKDILAYNHLPSDAQASTRTLRAIAIKRAAVPHTYLVVQTAQLTHIFDDVDAAFVHSCSLILCNVHQAAQLERATAARTAFLRGVSHELRTPIHALLSSCELLVEDARSAPLRLSAQFAANGGQSAEDHAALLANAIASGRQLMATVNNLLNLDALDALSPTPAPFFLAALEAMLVAQVDATLRDSGARVRIVCEHLLPPDVHILNGDFDLLKQALTALLDNAVTFTELGTITLRTTLEGGDETQLGSLVYDVIDTGPGIAADVGVVFDAVEKDAGGIGIGLSVARRVARALGGQLELRRTSSDGSWFRLRLDAPVLACRPSHPAQRISRSTRLRTFAFGGVVDAVQAQMLRAMLTAVGLKEATQNAAALVIVDAGATPPLESKQVALVLRPLDDGTSLPWPRAVPLIQPVCAEVLWAALGAALDVREQDPNVTILSSPSSPPPSSSVGTSEPVGESDFKRSRTISVAAPTRATLRILIVDDNRTNLDILCMYSRRRSFPYLSALNGSLAVEAYKAAVTKGDAPALVLMDLQMPVMDGSDATRRIRQFETMHGLRPCLIYMVSGQSSDADKRRAVAAGANGYYVKPLSLRTLDGLIDLHFPLV